MVVRVGLATICGSDVHTVTGRRKGDVPGILGHEITGEVLQRGQDVRTDSIGQVLVEGDRVTWSIAASCGRCVFCRRYDLPQKCETLFKYGHAPCDAWPHFNGGFAEIVYVRPGTTVLRVPEGVSDEEVAPINCALATVMHAVEELSVTAGDRVVVLGAGTLGLYAAAVLSDRGCGEIVVVDVDENRLARAGQFGATRCLSRRTLGEEEVRKQVLAVTEGRGADAVLEVCGVAESVPAGLKLLRIGGRLVTVGLVFPHATITLDGMQIVTRMLRIKGIHNYHGRHLIEAMRFVTEARGRYPFRELVTARFPLSEINTAFTAAQDRSNIRVAVVPE